MDSQPIAADILRGAGAIAEFLLGDPGERRKVYHMADAGHIPAFRLGTILCARKSTLAAWIGEQERRAVAANDNSPPCRERKADDNG